VFLAAFVHVGFPLGPGRIQPWLVGNQGGWYPRCHLPKQADAYPCFFRTSAMVTASYGCAAVAAKLNPQVIDGDKQHVRLFSLDASNAKAEAHGKGQ